MGIWKTNENDMKLIESLAFQCVKSKSIMKPQSYSAMLKELGVYEAK